MSWQEKNGWLDPSQGVILWVKNSVLMRSSGCQDDFPTISGSNQKLLLTLYVPNNIRNNKMKLYWVWSTMDGCTISSKVNIRFWTKCTKGKVKISSHKHCIKSGHESKTQLSNFSHHSSQRAASSSLWQWSYAETDLLVRTILKNDFDKVTTNNAWDGPKKLLALRVSIYSYRYCHTHFNISSCSYWMADFFPLV